MSLVIMRARATPTEDSPDARNTHRRPGHRAHRGRLFGSAVRDWRNTRDHELRLPEQPGQALVRQAIRSADIDGVGDADTSSSYLLDVPSELKLRCNNSPAVVGGDRPPHVGLRPDALRRKIESLSRTNTPRRIRGIGTAISAACEFLRDSALVLGICCTVGWVLHTAPASMSFDSTAAQGLDQPTFSAQIIRGSQSFVCNSSTAGPGGPCKIDLFGGVGLAPGSTVTTQVLLSSKSSERITNLSLNPLSACSQSARGTAPDLCTQVHLRIKCGSRQIFDGTATDLGRRTNAPIALNPLAVHGTEMLTTEVSLPSTLGNDYQGLSAQLPILLTASS